MGYTIHPVVQGSDEWFELRRRRVTGSQFSKVLVRDADKMVKLCDKLVEESLPDYVPTFFENDATRWGNKYEPEARKVYNLKILKKDNLVAKEVGFITRDDYECFGVSPDGVVFKDGVIVGACEIKCRSEEKYDQFQKDLKIQRDAICQIASYFVAVESLQWVEYVMYDPRKRYDNNLTTVRVYRDDKRVADKILLAEERLTIVDNMMKEMK